MQLITSLSDLLCFVALGFSSSVDCEIIISWWSLLVVVQLVAAGDTTTSWVDSAVRPLTLCIDFLLEWSILQGMLEFSNLANIAPVSAVVFSVCWELASLSFFFHLLHDGIVLVVLLSFLLSLLLHSLVNVSLLFLSFSALLFLTLSSFGSIFLSILSLLLAFVGLTPLVIL